MVLTAIHSYHEPSEYQELVGFCKLGEPHGRSTNDTNNVGQKQPPFPETKEKVPLSSTLAGRTHLPNLLAMTPPRNPPHIPPRAKIATAMAYKKVDAS